MSKVASGLQEALEGNFRKKPVVIQAIKTDVALTRATHEPSRLPDWLWCAAECGEIIFLGDHVRIKTLEGDMRAAPDDWIICGVKGELYPCKPDVFAQTYDAVHG